eukprot:TRINITY_DN7802_c0_g1_i1.p1 TRINITY_DN7802_c0_g1~~TRINITY_DN7802_c0_g1_i1.p1  ORF type:complete len:1257 (+),score=331.83 TRINITY_DN7802_c0_g1_i1:225-3773(+)
MAGMQVMGFNDISQKESELRNTIMGAVNTAKNHCSLMERELDATIKNLFMMILMEVKNLKNVVSVIHRPYILHSQELEVICSKILGLLMRTRIIITEMYSQDTLECHQSLDLCKNSFETAVFSLREFIIWINTSLSCYALMPNEPSLLDVPVPEDKDIARTDMMRCPRWILRQLYESKVNATMGGDKGTEIASLKTKIEEQEKIIKDYEEKAKGSSQLHNYGVIIKKKDEIIQQKEKEENILKSLLSEKDQEIHHLNHQYESIYEKYELLNTENSQNIVKIENFETQHNKIWQTNQELNKKLTRLQQQQQQLQLIKKMADVNQLKEIQSKNAELKSQVIELEKKLRIQEAQLRMSRINVDVNAPGYLQDVHMMAELHEPLKNDEVNEVDSLLEQMLDDHMKNIEMTKSKISQEHQIEDYESTSSSIIEWNVAETWMLESDKRVCLAQLILDTARDYEFIQVLGKLFPIGNEAEACVKSIVELYHDQNRSMELIKIMINWEVKNIKHPNQLFRGEEFPPRMIRIYTRLIGISFAQRTIGHLINEMIDQQISIELDDNPDMQIRPPTEEDKTKLQCYCQKFMDAILDSLEDMPKEFFQICDYLTKQVKKRFPDPEAEKAAVAGFIFLRFFGPCIVSPESFEMKAAGSREVSRSFLLIGKVIQSLANGVSSFKEEYLHCMHPFLEKYRFPMERFLKKMKEWPPRVNGDAHYLIKAENLLAKKKDQFKKVLENFPEASRGHWVQNVRTLPHLRLKEILVKFDTVVVATLSTNVSSANLLKPKKKEGEEKRNFPKINRSKFPPETSLLVQGLLKTLLDPEMCIPAVITKSLLPKLKDKGTYNQALNEISNSLCCLFCGPNQYDFIDGIIHTEINESTDKSEHSFLYDSFSKIIFTWFAKNYFSKWLHDCWNTIITEIIENNSYLEIDPEALKSQGGEYSIVENIQKLNNYYKQFLESAVKELGKVPDYFYEFFVCLHENSDKDDMVLKFLFINFFSAALEDPESYQLTKVKLSKNSTRTLGIIAEMLINTAKKSPSINVAEREEYLNRLNIWLQGEIQLSLNYLDFKDLDWAKKQTALMNLLDYILENQETIDSDLEIVETDSNHPLQSFSYTVAELIDSFVHISTSSEDKKGMVLPRQLTDMSSSAGARAAKQQQLFSEPKKLSASKIYLPGKKKAKKSASKTDKT